MLTSFLRGVVCAGFYFVQKEVRADAVGATDYSGADKGLPGTLGVEIKVCRKGVRDQ